MKIDAKLTFDKENESKDAQATYELVGTYNFFLGMQGLDCVEASFIDCGDKIELNLSRNFTPEDMNKLKEAMKNIEGTSQTIS